MIHIVLALLLFAAAVAVYFLLGWRLFLRKHTERHIEIEIRRHPVLYDRPERITQERDEYLSFALWGIIVWPLWWAGWAAMRTAADDVPLSSVERDAYEEALLDAIDHRDAKIKALEAQLGIYSDD